MANRERPLSPHLQVYRWQAQMTTSILHRASGVFLAIGALVFTYGLVCLAVNKECWDSFLACMTSPLGFVFLFIWSWAASYHLINGIRHLVQDAGFGFSIPDFVRSSMISIIGSLVLTVLIWLAVIYAGGAA